MRWVAPSDWAIRVSSVNTIDRRDVIVNTGFDVVSLADYPMLTTGFGRLKGFVHRPHIDPSVRPVQQKFYHQPLALRQPISDELRRMEREGSN
jgi:hypothetical protein